MLTTTTTKQFLDWAVQRACKKLKALANSANADEDVDLSDRMTQIEAFAKTLEGMGMKFQ